MTDRPAINSANTTLVKTWHERSLPAADEQMVIYNVTEHGLDFVPALAQLIQDSDEAAKGNDMLKTLANEPLITERYLGPAEVSGVGGLGCALIGQNYAWVTRGDGVSCMPIAGDMHGVQVGDMVLISPKAQRIIGKDNSLAACGHVAVVEAVPEGNPGQVIVKGMGETLELAWLHHSLLESPPAPGRWVIYGRH